MSKRIFEFVSGAGIISGLLVVFVAWIVGGARPGTIFYGPCKSHCFVLFYWTWVSLNMLGFVSGIFSYRRYRSLVGAACILSGGAIIVVHILVLWFALSFTDFSGF